MKFTWIVKLEKKQMILKYLFHADEKFSLQIHFFNIIYPTRLL